MKQEHLRNILELEKFLLGLKFKNIHITKKRIDKFNINNSNIIIEQAKYVHGRIKKNIRILDKNKFLLRLQKTKHGYYRIVVKMTFLNDKIEALLDIFLSLLNE